MTRLAIGDTPYKGLMPYDEEDAPFFFGREAEREIISANLMASRLTLLYGPSGVGKSSALRAGVAYYLRDLARAEFHERHQTKSAITIFNSWRDNPIAGLRAEISKDLEKVCGGGNGREPDSSFADFLKGATKRIGGKLLIVLDQFEEYFLYPQIDGEGSFAFEFVKALNSEDSRVNFLISIREDWLAKLDYFKTQVPSLFDNYLRIERLDNNAARRAIELPVEKYNEQRPPHQPAIQIAPGFAESVLAQLEKLANKNVLGDFGSGGTENSSTLIAETRIQTPYLQLVMTRLWNEAVNSPSHQLTPNMLDDPNRCENIIQSHLDDVMNDLTPSEQQTAALVFDRLVTPSGTKITQAMSDLAKYASVSEAEISPMLEKLTRKESGVLTQIAPSPGQRGLRYEIFHDVLGRPIGEWRKRYLQMQELARERQKSRRLRWGLVGAGALLLLMTGLTIFAFQQQREAKKQRDRADTALSAVQLASNALAIAKQNVEKQRDIAKNNEESALKAKADAEGQRLEAQRQKHRADEQARLARIGEQNAIQAKEDFVIASKKQAEAEAEAARNKARQGEIQNSLGIMNVTVAGFEAMTSGDRNAAIQYFTQARNLSKAYPDYESYLVFYIAENKAANGGVTPLAGVPSENPDEDLNEPDRGSIERQKNYLSHTTSGEAMNEKRKEATDSYKEAIGINQATDLNSTSYRARNLQRIGDVFLTSAIVLKDDAQFEEALRFYRQAAEEFRKAGKNTAEAILQTRMGDLTLELNSNKNKAQQNADQVVTTTKGFYEQAQTAYQKASNHVGEAAVLLKLGDLVLKFANDKAENISEVIRYYEQAATLYGRIQLGEKQANTYLLIANLCPKSQNQCQSLDKFEQARKTYQSARQTITDEAAKTRVLKNEKSAFNESVKARTASAEGSQALPAYLDQVARSYGEDPFGNPVMLGAIGDLFFNSDKQKADSYYQMQIIAWQKIGNKLEEGNTYLRLGDLYRGLRNRTKLIEYLNLARTAYKEVPSAVLEDKKRPVRDGLVSKLTAIAWMYQEQGERIAALDAFDEALQHIQQQDPSPGRLNRVSELLQGFATIARELRTFDAPHAEEKAQGFFGTVVGYFQKENDKYREASALEAAGNFYTDAGNKEKAIEYFDQARSGYKRTSYAYRQYDLVEKIKTVYLKPPFDENAAQAFFDKLVTEYGKDNDSTGEARALEARGSIYYQAGKKKESAAAYEAAVNAWVNANNRYAAALVLRNHLETIYKELGDTKKAEAAAKRADNPLKN